MVNNIIRAIILMTCPYVMIVLIYSIMHDQTIQISHLHRQMKEPYANKLAEYERLTSTGMDLTYSHRSHKIHCNVSMTYDCNLQGHKDLFTEDIIYRPHFKSNQTFENLVIQLMVNNQISPTQRKQTINPSLIRKHG